jgi:hypothetical protein
MTGTHTASPLAGDVQFGFWAALSTGVMTLVTAVIAIATPPLTWFTLLYGHQRAYLFEIAIISIVWLTLIPSAFMLAAVFRRDLSSAGLAGATGTQ